MQHVDNLTLIDDWSLIILMIYKKLELNYASHTILMKPEN